MRKHRSLSYDVATNLNQKFQNYGIYFNFISFIKTQWMRAFRYICLALFTISWKASFSRPHHTQFAITMCKIEPLYVYCKREYAEDIHCRSKIRIFREHKFFSDFPKIFRAFSRDFRRSSEGHTNFSYPFQKVSDDCRKFPKISISSLVTTDMENTLFVFVMIVVVYGLWVF